MELFKIFVTIVGIAMSVGYFPQAYKIWKNKSAANISIVTCFTFALGTLTYFVYGILIHDTTLIVSFIIGVFGSWSVLALAILYKNKL